MEKILELAGIPLLLFVICMYYGIRLLVLQDAASIRGKGKPPAKDEKKYATEAGKLIIFFGAATFLMAILVCINLYAAVAEIICATLVFGILWKKMNDKYGA